MFKQDEFKDGRENQPSGGKRKSLGQYKILLSCRIVEIKFSNVRRFFHISVKFLPGEVSVGIKRKTDRL